MLRRESLNLYLVAVSFLVLTLGVTALPKYDTHLQQGLGIVGLLFVMTANVVVLRDMVSREDASVEVNERTAFHFLSSRQSLTFLFGSFLILIATVLRWSFPQ